MGVETNKVPPKAVPAALMRPTAWVVENPCSIEELAEYFDEADNDEPLLPA